MQKDKEKGKAASYYRHITCLPLVQKLLTGVIAEEVQGFFDTNFLLTKNKKDAGENLGEQMIYCLLIKRKVKMKQNL